MLVTDHHCLSSQYLPEAVFLDAFSPRSADTESGERLHLTVVLCLVYRKCSHHMHEPEFTYALIPASCES